MKAVRKQAGSLLTAVIALCCGALAVLWPQWRDQLQAQTYQNFTYRTLNYPGATETFAQGISGTNIVGWYYTSSEQNAHGFVYNYASNSYSTLDYTDADGNTYYTRAYGISGNNIVGTYNNTSGSERLGAQGFLYDGSTFTTLPLIPGSMHFEALAIDGSKILELDTTSGSKLTAVEYNRSSDTYIGINDSANPGSVATGISGNTIVGIYGTMLGPEKGFTFNDSTLQFTPFHYTDASGAHTAYPYGISGTNIVGRYVDSSNLGHAFFYDGTNWTMLNYANAPNGLGPGGVDGANVVGSYSDSSGNWHGFLALGQPALSAYISDLQWAGTPTNGWGPVERDMSNGEQAAGDGHTISLHGITYAKGLGMHAPSVVTYNLAGQYTRFISDIGIDDEVGSGGSVVFQVWADGVKLYDSGVMTHESPTQTINVDVTGMSQLQLVVNVGTTMNGGHADWAGAYLSGGQQIIYELTVTKSGTGSGTVTTNPLGTTFTAGTAVTLSATADAGSTFAGWSGGCSGTSPSCTLTMSSNIPVTATFTSASGVTYISDLPWVGTPTNGWGPVEKDMSNGEQYAGDGHAISLHAVKYSKGLGVHANSVVTYNLAGQYTRFISAIGVDDEVGSGGSVVFQVWADGVEIYDSGLMTHESPTQTVNVDVTGKNQLQLVVNAGSKMDQGHGDWAGAYLMIMQQSTYTLTVTRDGTGTGSVGVNPTGTIFNAGTPVTLTATADTGSTFAGWSGGGCSGTGSCLVTMNADTNVTATFNLIPPTTYTLTVSKNGTGSGSVGTSPSGTIFNAGTPVTLNATADPGSTFAGWSGGGCSGIGSCVVTMNSDTNVTATFNLAPPNTYSLTVTTNGTGTGTVDVNPPGTNFNAGTPVTLTAKADSGSTFDGWSGGCSGTSLTCSLTMNNSISVTATFNSTGGGASYKALDYPGATSTYAKGFDGKNVVGYYIMSGTHGFLYDGTGWTSLDYPNATATYATAISAGIIGGYYDDGSGKRHGFMHSGTQWTPFDYPGAVGTEISGIQGNSFVGNYTDGSGQAHGFLVSVNTTYISDLPWVGTPINGWGPVEKDMSNGESAAGDGHTISLNGVKYAKGLGVHAYSSVTYNLGGAYTQFVSDIGIDDETGGSGSVVFQVWADGVKIYDSGLITATSVNQKVDVDVTGKNQLQLVVTNGGDGNSGDHADWAGAYLIGQ